MMINQTLFGKTVWSCLLQVEEKIALCQIIIVSFHSLMLVLITVLLVLILMLYTSNTSILEINALAKILLYFYHFLCY